MRSSSSSWLASTADRSSSQRTRSGEHRYLARHRGLLSRCNMAPQEWPAVTAPCGRAHPHRRWPAWFLAGKGKLDDPGRRLRRESGCWPQTTGDLGPRQEETSGWPLRTGCKPVSRILHPVPHHGSRRIRDLLRQPDLVAVQIGQVGRCGPRPHQLDRVGDDSAVRRGRQCDLMAGSRSEAVSPEQVPLPAILRLADPRPGWSRRHAPPLYCAAAEFAEEAVQRA